MFIIQMVGGLYVLKTGGWNLFVKDPRHATTFYSREAAMDGRPGHHKDMGGAGFVGRTVSRTSEVNAFERALAGVEAQR